MSEIKILNKSTNKLEPFDIDKIKKIIRFCIEGIADYCDSHFIVEEVKKMVYNGITNDEILESIILAAKSQIEKEPMYNKFVSQVMLKKVYKEVLDIKYYTNEIHDVHIEKFEEYLGKAVYYGLINKSLFMDGLNYTPDDMEIEMTSYDEIFNHKKLANALRTSRDRKFKYVGIQTVYDRYLLHVNGKKIETPQYFFMRVAMGLAINEDNPTDRAIEFYNLISSFDLMPSTPTLFNSGLVRSQMSSCFLLSCGDDLRAIFKLYGDCAQLAKWAGGLGIDFTPIRSTGSLIKGTNGPSSGAIPYTKIMDSICCCVNQCFSGETVIYTNLGPRKIKVVTPGELVLGSDGEYRQINEIMIYEQNSDPMLSIDVRNGFDPIEVTSGHPILSILGSNKCQTIKQVHKQLELGHLKISYNEVSKVKQGDYVGQAIPTEIVDVPEMDLDTCYLYGLMLGDGHFTKDKEFGISINPEQDDIVQFVKKYLSDRNINYWVNERNEKYIQIKWSKGGGSVRCKKTGQMTKTDGTFPFVGPDLYNGDEKKKKTINHKYLHLPKEKTKKILLGLIKSDGSIKGNGQVYFENTSEDLIHTMKYLFLRLEIPLNINTRTRKYNHTGTRVDGTKIKFDNTSTTHIFYMPSVDLFADDFKYNVSKRRWWFVNNGSLFSRVENINQIKPHEYVYDLKVDGVKKYVNSSLSSTNGGKRPGSACAYMETWHYDYMDFLELRKNTGDETRRVKLLNIAAWIPDLFMERVEEDKMWSFFSPDEVPDLHYTYGEKFKKQYLKYEKAGIAGKLRTFKQLSAVTVWRKHLSMLFESSHPWATFKDTFNIRNTIKNVGPILSTNLCCVTGDQLIPTNIGMYTAEELYFNSSHLKNLKVAGLNKVEKSTTMMQPVQYGKCIKLLTKEGYTHSVTLDHKVWVKDKGYVEAQNLSKGDKLILQQISLWPETKCADYEEDISFLIGLITGDGTFTKYSVCVDIWKDKGMTDKCKCIIHDLLNNHPYFECNKINTSSTKKPKWSWNEKADRYRITSAPLKQLLEHYGFTDDKFTIPEFILTDKNNMKSYLEGLYYADGTVQGGEVTTISLCSTKKHFLQQIQIILLNFGAKSSLTKMDDEGWRKLPDGKGEYNKYYCNSKYRLHCTSVRACQILNDITQLGKYRDNIKFLHNLTKDGYEQKMYATFTAFEKLNDQNAYCISMDNDDHLWTCNGFITKNTEISLPTSSSLQEQERQQVCNLASVNLANHMSYDSQHSDIMFDYEKLAKTVKIGIRMLDNVIDLNFYATDETKCTNENDRPVGLGIMGFQDLLYKIGISYDSEGAINTADKIQEFISYYAIDASCELAKEKGKFPSYEGSEWEKGKLPIDTLKELKEYRSEHGKAIDTSFTIDTDTLRKKIKEYGIRNSYLLAIAPTVTISNIVGVTQSIEPMYKNLFVKSNLSGEFTYINEYLVKDLKNLDMWNQDIIDLLKYNDGSIQNIDGIPEQMKRKYLTAFEIEPVNIIKCAAARQKWTDQAISLNLYLDKPDGKKLSDMYMQAWKHGLKSTYYLRIQTSTGMEASTVDVNKFSKRQKWMSDIPEKNTVSCNPEDGVCEVCQ